MPEYRYTRLSHPGNIRLLRLLPNKESKGELRCELFEYPLGSSDKVTRPYEALSYFWGSQRNPQSILVDNSSFKITQNLYDALSTLQDYGIPRVIWVDAICIDQMHEEEKLQQIQYMTEIYAKASRVIVWLGEAYREIDGQYDKEIQDKGERDHSVEQAIEAIRLVGENPTKLLDIKQFKPAILKLLQRNWFRRIWVLQEVAAARHILITCDSAEIDGYTFCLGLEALQTTFEEFSQQVTFLIRRAIFRPRQVSRRYGRLSLDICSLGELMDKYHTHEATELRDKVYALLGMSSDGLGMTNLISDYDKGWEIIMHNLVKILISESVFVETWSESEMALIKGSGCILGQVSEIRRNTDSGRSQTVEAFFKNISEQPGCIEDGSVHWALETSANPVQKGDLICLMKGAINPMIIRLHGDHFDIIMIAPVPPKQLQRTTGYIEWSELARSAPFTRNFPLVWNWKTCQGKLPGSGKHATSVRVNNWYPGTELEYHLEKAIGTWNVALILGDLGEDEKAEEKIQEAIVGYEEVARENNMHKPENQYAAGHRYNAIVNKIIRKCDVDIDTKDYHYDRTPLLWAARNGHEAVLKVLLDGKAKTESKDRRNGRTPLSLAAQNGHDAVVKVLLDGKANIESMDKSKLTPLSLAAQNGHDAVVKVLLDGKANIESMDNYDGRTPLSLAAANGHEVAVKVLLDGKAEIDSLDKRGRTPLSLAAQNGHEAVVKVLIDGNTNIEWKDDFGNTPLSLAAQNGHEAVVKLLLDSKAEIDSIDEIKLTPLSLAARNGHEAVVKLLLDGKAKIDPIDKSNPTPLSLAARNGHEAVVKLLLDGKAKTEWKDRDGRTALSLATTNGHDAVVKVLLDGNANIEWKDKSNPTPLSIAAQNGHEAVVKVLLDGKASTECKDKSGQTPLSLAAANGHEAVVKVLLDGKANIESKDKRKLSPLSLAAGNGHEAVVKVLLDSKANIESKDKRGRTPLSLAAANRHEAVVKVLLNSKAEIESKDNFGNTPLSLAADNGLEAMVKLLSSPSSPSSPPMIQS